MTIDSTTFSFKAVLLGQKPYMSKKNEQKFQYKFSAFGNTFKMTGDVNLEAMISDLAKGAIMAGLLTVDLASFNDSLYLQFKGFVNTK